MQFGNRQLSLIGSANRTFSPGPIIPQNIHYAFIEIPFRKGIPMPMTKKDLRITAAKGFGSALLGNLEPFLAATGPEFSRYINNDRGRLKSEPPRLMMSILLEASERECDSLYYNLFIPQWTNLMTVNFLASGEFELFNRKAVKGVGERIGSLF